MFERQKQMDPNSQNRDSQNQPNLAPTGLPRSANDATNNESFPDSSHNPSPSLSPEQENRQFQQQPQQSYGRQVLPDAGAQQTQPPAKNQPPNGPSQKNNPNSTQNTLLISEIRDGIVIMNDGSFRAVIMAKSINFDLMSPGEQESVEYAYQGFLNSLTFPVQILVRSQKIDIAPYIEKLDKIRTEHDNMLLAMLMEDYVNFMVTISEQSNIMDKKFYVVVPYYSSLSTQRAVEASKSLLTSIFGKKEQIVTINENDLNTAKTELRNRVQSILAGLMQCGVQGLPLDSEELIELYYDAYNPDTAIRQPLKNFDDLTAPIVTKGEGFAPQEHLKRELQ